MALRIRTPAALPFNYVLVTSDAKSASLIGIKNDVKALLTREDEEWFEYYAEALEEFQRLNPNDMSADNQSKGRMLLAWLLEFKKQIQVEDIEKEIDEAILAKAKQQGIAGGRRRTGRSKQKRRRSVKRRLVGL